jgi:hypothetical protein
MGHWEQNGRDDQVSEIAVGHILEVGPDHCFVSKWVEYRFSSKGKIVPSGLLQIHRGIRGQALKERREFDVPTSVAHDSNVMTDMRCLELRQLRVKTEAKMIASGLWEHRAVARK